MKFVRGQPSSPFKAHTPWKAIQRSIYPNSFCPFRQLESYTNLPPQPYCKLSNTSKQQLSTFWAHFGASQDNCTTAQLHWKMKGIIIQARGKPMIGTKAKKMGLLFASCHWQVKVQRERVKHRVSGLHKEPIHHTGKKSHAFDCVSLTKSQQERFL